MIVTILEAARSSTPKGSRYTRIILLTLAALLIAKMVWFAGSTQGDGARPLVDFDMFHLVGELIWRGEVHLAYRFETLLIAQRAVTDGDSVMPWTYPPQFDLMMAPLALMPRWLAYGLFTAVTLIGYLAVLKRLAGEHFPLLLFVTFPVLTIMIAGGQNGFLTGMLIGLACLAMERCRSLAGIPLGLMIIKPHLAATFAVYTVFSRRWATVGVAAATVIITSAIATWILGIGIWSSVFGAAKEARVFLEHGMYPFFRMVSVYAALYSLGLPAWATLAAQITVAGLCLLMVCFTAYRAFPVRSALGLAAMGSPLVSPYAYDYDLPIFGIGLALLLPDLMRLGTARERAVIYGLTFLTSLFGLAQSFRLQLQYGPNAKLGEEFTPLSLAGLFLIVILGMAWRILERRSKPAPEPMPDPAQSYPTSI
jgi:hypothetical protein